MEPKIEIFKDNKDMARHIGNLLSELSQNHQEINIALSGGSTPKAIFEVLAHEYNKKIDWSNLRFFWGDERCVPPNHNESNFGMAREHLFDFVSVKGDNIFRVKGELLPEEAADDYIATLEEQVPMDDDLPLFDLIFLGMGDDGHTASIFPYQIGLWNSENSCELAQHPETGQFRITLSGRVINHAREIILLVTGANKAAKVREVIQQTGDFYSYPVSLVDRAKSSWFLDEAAGELLPK